MNGFSKKYIPIIVVALFVISMVPLFVMSFYNHPAIDDYYYGIKTHHAYQNGNFSDVLKAAVEQVKETYINWQGSYSAVFLFSLHPAIYGEQFYCLSTFILLPLLILSSLIFSYTLMRKIFSISGKAYIVISLVLIATSVHLAPSPVQSYYWWNGSVYYTLFYSLMLLFFSLIHLMLSTEKSAVRLCSFVAATIMAFTIAGGNYTTALLTAMVLFCLIVYLARKKDKHLFYAALIFVVFIISFAVSILAPGNAVRAENYKKISAFSAILLSIRYAIYYIAEWTDFTVAAIILILTPFLACAAKRSKFSFRYPIPVLIFLFLFFAAQFTPPIYGMGHMGTGIEPATSGNARILNIIYYSYFYFTVISVYYISGSIIRKKGDFTKPIFDFVKTISGKTVISLIVSVAILLPTVAPRGEMCDYRGGGTAFTAAMYSLLSGEAGKWDEENNARYALLTDTEVNCVEFTPFSVQPELLFYGDLTQDPDWMWSNKPMREYFEKEKVVTRWTY